MRPERTSSPGRLLMSNVILRNLDAHQRGVAAIIVAAVVGIASVDRFSSPEVHLITVWNSFALTSVILAWLRITTSDAFTVVRAAKLNDSGRAAIFCFVIFATLASLAAVASLLAQAKTLHGRVLTEHVLLAFGTVACSWTLLHTVFTLHYAHRYYARNERNDRDDAPDEETGSGLEFPNEKRPDFLDFAYFSFVIGMTFQVSDVQITSQTIRRLALVHGLLSFIFNTVILALAINLASGLLTPGS
jgi:uncharacterized membrane protein